MVEDSSAFPYQETAPSGVEVWSTVPFQNQGAWDNPFLYPFLSWHQWLKVLWIKPKNAEKN